PLASCWLNALCHASMPCWQAANTELFTIVFIPLSDIVRYRLPLLISMKNSNNRNYCLVKKNNNHE
ncbi:hypothetical protein, partial [Vibrio anguillarum]|uniref:hypothetical protein n=1 Tax=Vibrio anguillarum TaxID=55601 RepID=UPI001BE4573C